MRGYFDHVPPAILPAPANSSASHTHLLKKGSCKRSITTNIAFKSRSNINWLANLPVLAQNGSESTRITISFKMMQNKRDIETLSHSRLVLGGIVLLALLIRLVAINFGLPYLYRPDEDMAVGGAMHILQGRHFPDVSPIWSHFFMYAAAAVLEVLSLIGRVLHFTTGSTFLVFSDSPVPRDAVLAVRIFSAILGAVAVYLSFCLGRLLRTPRCGLLTALFAALSFIHVRETQFARIDSLAVTLMLASLLTAIRYLKNPDWTKAIGCGALMGLTISTKVSFVTLLPSFAICAMIVRPEAEDHRDFITRMGHVSATIFSAVLCFFIGSPAFALTPDHFSESLFYLRLWSTHGPGGPDPRIPSGYIFTFLTIFSFLTIFFFFIVVFIRGRSNGLSSWVL